MRITKTKIPTIEFDKNAHIDSVSTLFSLCCKNDLKAILASEGELLFSSNNFLQAFKDKVEESGFCGYEGEKIKISCAVNDKKYHNIVILGCSKKEDEYAPDDTEYHQGKYRRFLSIGTSMSSCSKTRKLEKVILAPSLLKSYSCGQVKHGIQAVVVGFIDGLYCFSKYLTSDSSKKKIPSVSQVTVVDSIEDVELQKVRSILTGLFMTKDLIHYPANDLYPESYTEFIKEEFKDISSVTVKVLKKKEIEDLGMNLLLAVSKGSDRDPQIIALEYRGDSSVDSFSLAMVGKGVTFDSGGLSLKPSNHMMSMKTDMAGAATVSSVIKVLAARKTKINVVAVMVLTENMVNGCATRPGDIVTSMSGQTVEILNTDAEGRLILADAVFYTQTKYRPDHMIDLATLTGAMSVALGGVCAGLFSNCDELAKQITESGNRTGDLVWRLPIWRCYDKMIDTSIADMKNISNTGTAGSITGAKFIQRFIAGQKSWAHLDIAGVAFLDKIDVASGRSSATGFGVKLLLDMIESNVTI